LATDKSPFTGKGAPRRAKDVAWVKPKLTAEIEFAGWTGEGKVRQAAFKALRKDKPAKEVRAEEAVPAQQLERTASEKLKARAAKAGRSEANVVLGTAISNPEKLLWPAEGKSEAYSKIDLARYLEEVGPWMIEHLRGRPCSIIRTPDGINDERFFQRHAMLGMSNLISLVKVEGDKKPISRSTVSRDSLQPPRSRRWNIIPGTINPGTRQYPAAWCSILILHRMSRSTK
jgi:bifunctional non-homologous end joining protein LigD